MHRLLTLYPLVLPCLALIVGVVAGDNLADFSASWGWWLLAAVLSVASAAVFMRRAIVSSFALLLSFVFVGVFLTLRSYDSLRLELPDAEEEYCAVVVSEPEERGRIVRFDMTVLSGSLKGHSVRVALLKDTVDHRYCHLRVGSGIVASSVFKAPKNYYDSNFDYVRYLRGRGIVAQTFISYKNWKSAVLDLHDLPFLQRVRVGALSFRRQLLDRFGATGLDADAFALTSAMTFGNRIHLSEDVEDIYSITGISHILSLSGLHLSIIYALLCFLTLGRRRRVWREIILLMAVWSYVLIAGAEVALVRSAIMISIYSIVSISGREPMSLNVLAFAAMVMLIACPLSLFDISFQLSFLAIGFIMALHRPVCTLIPLRIRHAVPGVDLVWQSLVTSVVAQLGTAPLIAYYFGRLPVYFLLANLIAIPVTTLILYLSVALLFVSYVPLLGGVAVSLIATALSILVAFLNSSMTFVASLPCSSVDGVIISTGQVFALYGVIVTLCMIGRLLVKGIR